MEISYPNLQRFYKQVFDATISDRSIADELRFISCFFEEWAGNFLHPFGADLYKHGKSNSILYCYMASQSFVFDWLAHTVIFAHYQTGLRELRTILENLFYTYSLDMKFKRKSVDEKYQILEDMESKGKELHGKVVFEKSGYVYWEQSYSFYRQLCRFVHIHTSASVEPALRIAKEGFPEAIVVEYDKQSFLQCSSAWRKLARLSLALAVDLCQKLNVKISELNPDYLSKIW